MSNVIPIRPDPLRNLYELIDSIHDTNPTPETKRLAEEKMAQTIPRKTFKGNCDGEDDVFPA